MECTPPSGYTIKFTSTAPTSTRCEYCRRPIVTDASFSGCPGCGRPRTSRGVLGCVVALVLNFCCTAHAGQPIRRLRIVNRGAVHVARAHGRAAAGFPLRQAINHGAEALAYTAGTAFRVSGLMPSPNGVIANILVTPFRR